MASVRLRSGQALKLCPSTRRPIGRGDMQRSDNQTASCSSSLKYVEGKLHEKRIYPGTRHDSLKNNTAVGIPKAKVTESFSPKMTFLRRTRDTVTVGSLYSTQR